MHFHFSSLLLLLLLPFYSAHWLSFGDRQPEKHLSLLRLAQCPIFLVRSEFTWHFPRAAFSPFFHSRTEEIPWEFSVSNKYRKTSGLCMRTEQTWTHSVRACECVCMWIIIIIFCLKSRMKYLRVLRPRTPNDLLKKKIWFLSESNLLGIKVNGAFSA